MERRIKSLVRWNATAMVVRANKYDPNIGGHLATYASLATLLEVGFNHFFRGSYRIRRAEDLPGDFVYFQGHASPGVYARAFLEGRLSEKHLENFRHELREHPGLVFLSASLADAGFLAVPDGVHGSGPDLRDLSGALHEVSGASRHHPGDAAQGVGVSGRRRKRRTGKLWER